MKQVILFIFVMFAIGGCTLHQTAHNTNDRFPGFSQVADGKTNSYYVDSGSIKRTDDGVITFKLLQILPDGYQIQDALANSPASILRLPGVKYNNDGISTEKCAGDSAEVICQDETDLGAVVRFVLKKFDEQRMIAGNFDDIKALELLYGPYNPDIKCSMRKNMPLPDDLGDGGGFKNDLQEAQGVGLVEVALSQQYVENAKVKHILVTSTKPNALFECHACCPLLSAAIFVKAGNTWHIESEFPYLGLDGGYGKPPDLSWLCIGKNNYVMVKKLKEASGTYLNVMQFGNEQWRPILTVSEPRLCYQNPDFPDMDVDMNIAFGKAARGYPDAVITTTKIIGGNKTVSSTIYKFSDGQYLVANTLNQKELPTVADNQAAAYVSTMSHEEDPASLIGKILQTERSNDRQSLYESLSYLEGLPKPASGDKEEANRLNKIGLGYLKAKQYHDAALAFDSAAKVDLSDAKLLSNLGFAEMLDGDLSSAEKHLYSSVTLAPTRSVAWGDLGELFARNGNKDDATTCFLIGYEVSSGKTDGYLKDLAKDDDQPVIRDAAVEALNKIAAIQQPQ